MEYRWRWFFWRWPYTFHVYFMLFVHHFPHWLRENWPRQTRFLVEYGLYLLNMILCKVYYQKYKQHYFVNNRQLQTFFMKLGHYVCQSISHQNECRTFVIMHKNCHILVIEHFAELQNGIQFWRCLEKHCDCLQMLISTNNISPY